MTNRKPAPLRSMALVGVGSAVGALLRWQIAEIIGTEPGRLPWETLLVNLAGCLAIGFAAARLVPGSDRWLLGVTGVLGGFTTFSAFANETRGLLDGGNADVAVLYVVATLVGGLAAVTVARRAAS